MFIFKNIRTFDTVFSGISSNLYYIATQKLEKLADFRTLAIGYKREFSSHFGFSPAVDHQSLALVAGFHRTDPQCEHRTPSIKNIKEALCISDYATRKAVQSLEESHLIRKIGSGPSTAYTLQIDSIEFLTQLQVAMEQLKKQIQ